MTVREVGQGRAVWLAGWSAQCGFSRLLRSAIFLATHREAEAGRLDVSGGDELFVYAWPERRMVGLMSQADEPIEATLRCDPTIVSAAEGEAVIDVVTGETLGAAAQLCDGLTVTAIPHCLRLLRVGED